MSATKPERPGEGQQSQNPKKEETALSTARKTFTTTIQRIRQLSGSATFGIVTIVALLSINVPPTYADCNPPSGTDAECAINGKKGTLQCIEGHIECVVEPPSPAVIQGILTPQYYVLTVVYAPPGTNGGQSGSSVVYASGSTTGTKISSSSSWKDSYNISYDIGASLLSIGGGWTMTSSTTDNRTVSVQKSNTLTITNSGPPVDGIDHNRDAIWLQLRPRIGVTVRGNDVTWKFQNDKAPEIEVVYVGWLKNPSTMPNAVKQALSTHGIGEASYGSILKFDPFADGPATPDPARFLDLFTTLPYEPPFSASDAPLKSTFTLTNQSGVENATLVQEDDQTSLSGGLGGNTGSLAFALKDASTWTWTTSSMQSDSSMTNQSATATIGGPKFGYNGPTMVAVYLDTLFQTFLFVLKNPGTTALHGKIVPAPGKSAAVQEVVAVVGGKTHRTFTDANGNYSFPGRFDGQIQLRAGSMVRTLPQIQPGQEVNLSLQ